MPAMLDAPCAPSSRVGCVLRTTPSTGGILGSRPGGPWQAAKGPNGHRQPFPLFPFSPFPLFPFSPFSPSFFPLVLAPMPPPLLLSFSGTGVSPVRFRHWWGGPPGPLLSSPTEKCCNLAGVPPMVKHSGGTGFQPGRGCVVSPGRTWVSARLLGLFRNKSDSLPFLCGN